MALAHPPSGGTQWILAIVSIAVAAAGILYARRRYADTLPQEEGGIWDRCLPATTSTTSTGRPSCCPARSSPRWPAFTADAKVVDGAVNGVGRLVQGVAAALRPLQTGLVRSYGAGILFGAVGLLVWILVRGGVIL